MIFDIVWTPPDSISGARPYLKRHPVELLIQNHWRFGWGLLDPAPVPDANGKVDPKTPKGCAVWLRQPGIERLQLGGVKPDKTLAAAEWLEFADVGAGMTGANVLPSFWTREDVTKKIEKEVEEFNRIRYQLDQEGSERQQRNAARQQLKVQLFQKYKVAVAALMGVPRPHGQTDEVIEAIFLMSRGRENIPEPIDYMKNFIEDLRLEEEPVFEVSDDLVEFKKFALTAMAQCVKREKKVVPL